MSAAAATGAGRVDALLAARVDANERFFAAEADRLTQVCHEMAERFARGGRLLAFGARRRSTWSDARHVAVEFVHPVIVGKRALPALALAARARSRCSRSPRTSRSPTARARPSRRRCATRPRAA